MKPNIPNYRMPTNVKTKIRHYIVHYMVVIGDWFFFKLMMAKVDSNPLPKHFPKRLRPARNIKIDTIHKYTVYFKR